MLANKLLFLGSIGFAPLTVLAQNDCTSRLISCFAFPINVNSGVFDFELVYDQIPDGSISSICQNTINAFQSTGLGTPGCHCSTLSKAEVRGSKFGVPLTRVENATRLLVAGTLKSELPLFHSAF